MINCKRVYDAPAEDDGYRVLVDRLWPRGIKKKRSRLRRVVQSAGALNGAA